MSNDPSAIDPEDFESLVEAVRELHGRVARIEDRLASNSPSTVELGAASNVAPLRDDIASIGSSLDTVLAALDHGDTTETAAATSEGDIDDLEVVDLSESRVARRARPAGWQPVSTRRAT